jgi:hypothetical protein
MLIDIKVAKAICNQSHDANSLEYLFSRQAQWSNSGNLTAVFWNYLQTKLLAFHYICLIDSIDKLVNASQSSSICCQNIKPFSNKVVEVGLG